jgi:hypothetical protein
MMKATSKTNSLARWEWLVYTPIVVSMAGSIIVLLAQVVIWLTAAKWYWLKLPDIGVHIPVERWPTGDLGADKILLWLSNDAPVFLWLVLIIPLTWRMITAITVSLPSPTMSAIGT